MTYGLKFEVFGMTELPFKTRFSARPVRKFPKGPEMTKQSFKDQCDINRIMASYAKTGVIAHMRDPGTYENLPDSMDYHHAMNVVTKSREAFEALPANLRDRFVNEPQQLLRFLGNTDNKDEAIKLGLIPRPKPPEAPQEGSPPPQAAKPPKSAKPAS